MPHPGHRPGLLERARPTLGQIGRARVRDELLKRHRTLEKLVLGQPDAAHSARPELVDQPEAPVQQRR